MRGPPGVSRRSGRATADAFGGADVIAATSTQEGLLAALPRRPGRVLFAGAEGARRLLPDALGADVVVLYRTVALRPESWPDCDLVVLASASAARAYAALGVDRPGRVDRARDDAGRRRRGSVCLAEAMTHDVPGLVEAVERAALAS